MAVFTKDALYPGTYSVPNPDGTRRKVTFTPADVKHLAARLKEMTAAGLQVPLSWAHQDEAKPMSPERRAELVKLTPGHVSDAELAPEGFLVVKTDVPSDDDAKRLPSVRFCSPEITKDWVDGTGRKWPGLSITHLAITPKPVNHRQQPFRQVRMSLDTVRLSLADYEGEKMAEEKDEVEGKVEKEPEEKVDEAGGKLKAVLECLARLGLVMPQDTNTENLLDRLHTAALTKEAADGGSTAEEPKAADQSPVMMSLETKLQALQARLLKAARGDLKARVKALVASGRITPHVAKGLEQEAATVRLSLDPKGELADCRLLYKLEAYEALPDNKTGFGASRMSLDESAGIVQSAERTGAAWQNDKAPETPEEVKAAVDAFDQTLKAF